MSFLHFFESYEEIENIRQGKLHFSLLKVEKHVSTEHAAQTYESEKEFIIDCACANRDCEWCNIQNEYKSTRETEEQLHTDPKSKEILRKEKKCKKLTHERMVAFYEKYNAYYIKRIKLFDLAIQTGVDSYDWDQTNDYLLGLEAKLCEITEYRYFFAMIGSLENTLDAACRFINNKLKFYAALPKMITRSAFNKIIGYGKEILDDLKIRFARGYDKSKNAYQQKFIPLPRGFEICNNQYYPTIDSVKESYRSCRNDYAASVLLDEFDKISEEKIVIKKPQTQSVKFDKNNIVKMNKTIVDFITQWKQVSEVDSLSDLISSDIAVPFMKGGVDISMLSTT